ncbi:uncharacterized protein LOC108813809 isoform X2 [Raphanus sativus]|uniref:Uncharacterized protein LOC108813809 isoform X2 n=1 Tax=Raphanus sativus TaxID=3726 RepID=A0A6J0JYQ3_RAPSA|nr:uncharacterized protein LOC108813809 isoform X2 [Raphanus sativus]
MILLSLTPVVVVVEASASSLRLPRPYSVFSYTTTCRRLRSIPFPSLECSCLNTNPTSELEEEKEEEEKVGLSVLGSEIPWEDNNVWSTFALYMFCLHIPLSFGGLSLLSRFLHLPLLLPQSQVLSLVLLQMLELSLTLFLLTITAKPQFKSIHFLNAANSTQEEGRNWLVGSALGFATLVSFIFLTSLVAHQLFPSQLFGIGCVLGGCYSWSGNLASSVVVHSLYNALTLLLALRS